MMGPLSRTVLVSLAALGTLSTPVSLAAETSEPGVAAAAAKRQIAMRDAMHELQEARLAYSAKRYSEAVEHYRNALAVVPKSTAAEKQQKFIKDSLSDALIAKAIDYRSVGRKDEAVEFLTEALELSPDNQRAKLELAHTQDAVRTNPAISPQHLAEVAEVSRLLTQAYGYMDLGQYNEAIETFQAVRKYDAYNNAAMRGIEQAHRRRQAYFKDARDSAHAKTLAEMSSLWEEEPPLDALPTEPATAAGGAEMQGLVDSEVEQACADSLARMVMPQIVFEEASITEIIETLQNQILRFEAAGQGMKRPINILGNFGAPDSDGYKELMNKRVNLNLSQVSVREVLDMLTRQLGITYYYTPLGVELSYSGKDFGPLVERSFTVPPHFFDADEPEDDDDDEDDSFGESSHRVSVHRVNPVQVLKQMGISFPEGAMARYMPSTRTLHVRNTAHNMEEIREALNVPLSELRQIVLNVLVMQTTESEMEELGFDWLVHVGLGDKVFSGGGLTQAASIASGLPLPAGADLSAPEGDYMTGGLRSGSQVLGHPDMDTLISKGSPREYANTPETKSPGIFSLRGVWSAADVAVIMRGLNQRKGTDILQNPRFVFSPGVDEQVTFVNVREMFYPEDYEQGEVQTSTGRVVTEHGKTEEGKWNRDDIQDAYYVSTVMGTGAFPTNFVRFGFNEEGAGGIGTILQIHKAEVTDTNLVSLDLTTTVNEFEGFINWGSPIGALLFTQPSWKKERERDDGEVNVKNEIGEAKEIVVARNYILKPIFKRKLVNTSVTVSPGSVLVFAGLKDAKTIRYEDKVPVLGDLPLVGRFFRSEGTSTNRKILIYFAKVDLVDPAGRDVITGERPEGIGVSSGL